MAASSFTALWLGAAGPSTETRTHTTDAHIKISHWTVVDTWLTLHGVKTALRGVSQYMLAGWGDDSVTTLFTGADLAAFAADLATCGYNCVRFPLRPTTTTEYKDGVVEIIEALADEGIYTMLDAHANGIWDGDDWPTETVTNDTAEAAADFLMDLWDYMPAADRPWVLMEPTSEPQGISDAVWLSGMNAAIDVLRARGYDGPIFVDGNNFAWSYPSNAASVLAHDPQIVLAAHRYATADGTTYLGDTDPTDNFAPEWVDGAAADGIAIIVGEWGPFNAGLGTGQTLQENLDGWVTNMQSVIETGNAADEMAGFVSWIWVWSDDNTQNDYTDWQGTQTITRLAWGDISCETLSAAPSVETRTHTTDALLQATSTRTHTTDALLLATETRTHTTDALLLATLTRQHATDALLLATLLRTHTTDALLLATVTETHTTDALLLATSTRSHSTDARIVSRVTRTHTTDALLLATETVVHTTDALLVIRGTETHTTDALILATLARQHATDALLLATATETHSTDALLLATETVVHTADALLLATLERSHTTDAVIGSVTAVEHTTDAYLLATLTRTHTTDALIVDRQTDTHTTDALLLATETVVHSTDALLTPSPVTHTTDALLVAVHEASHATDALLLSVEVLTHTTDALVSGARTVTHSTDATLTGTVTRSHTTDAFIGEPTGRPCSSSTLVPLNRSTSTLVPLNNSTCELEEC
jgi:hypothetical protein